MNFHKVIQLQINQYLSEEMLLDPSIQNFIAAVNASYISYEKDITLLNYTFKINEENYQNSYKDLKHDYEVKKKLLENLKLAVKEIDQKNEIHISRETDDSLILNYINTQIIKKRETENDLFKTHQLLTTLLSNLNSGIIVEDENQKVLFTNEMFCDYFSISLSPNELIGTDCKDYAEKFKNLFKKPTLFVAEINKLLYFKQPILNQLLEMKNGKFIERHYIPIYINKIYKGNLWKYTDVTEKIIIQKNLKQSEENFRNIIEHATDIIYKSNKKGLFIFVNPVAERITGYTKEELFKMHFSELIREDYKLKTVQFYLNQIDKKISSTYFEFPIITKKGNEIWIAQSVQFAIIDLNTREYELTALAIDITKQKLSEIALKESNQKLTLLQSLIDNSSDDIQVATEEGKLFYYNKEAQERLGISSQEMGKLSVFDIEESFKDLFAWENHILKLKQKNGITVEGININQSTGKKFPVEVTARFILVNGEGYVIANSRDITARKQVENRLKKQEEKYRNIIANMNLGLIEVNSNEEILYANLGFCNLSGYPMEELIGKKASAVFVLKDNIQFLKEKNKLRSSGISDIYQLQVKNKKGEIRWWAVSGAPNYNDSGELIGSIGIHLDITEQKRLEIELEASKIKAEEASKAKEAFLANMSHEIRTPLNAIIGMIQELGKAELNSMQRNYVENSLIASKHLLSIINNILDISKIEAGEFTLENEHFILDRSINNVLSIMSSRIQEKVIYIKAVSAPNISKALIGDSLRIEQVLLNLIGNAIKFTKTGGITIKCNLLDDNEADQKIQITVSDTGIGIDKRYLKNIFNKFSQEDKTISRKYGGTGLGLAITFELIQLMNGKIDVTSEKNVGTTFYITVTLKKGDINSIKSNSKVHETINFNGLKLLLVEDNELNRLVAQNTFKHYNCILDEAFNGLEAIEKLKQNKYDIILMDIQMPEMDGLEATEIIRTKMNINTPIVALTANAFKSEIEKCKSVGMNDYITKPFEESEFLKIISKHIPNNIAKQPLKLFPSNNEISHTAYDLSLLKEMSKGDTGFIKKMIELFTEQAQLVTQQLLSAREINDNKTITQLAHKLKPSIDNLRIGSIKEEIRELEKLSKEEISIEKRNALIDKVSDVLLEVIKGLELERI